MLRKTSYLVFAVMLGAAGWWQSASAAKPSQEILPASTKFSFSIANQKDYQERVSTTGIGKLLLDPAMQPFLEDLPRQIRDESKDVPFEELWIDLGVERGDLDALTEGEVVWALVDTDTTRPSRVMIADVTNRTQQVEELLHKIGAAMDGQNAKKSKSEVSGTVVTSFDTPAQGKVPAGKLIYAQQDDLLVFTDSLAMAELILKNITGEAKNSLADQKDYQQVIESCRERAGDEAPDATLFLVPIDLSEALKELSPKQDEQADEGIELARKHNFDAISAVGSFVNVGEDTFDYHLRIAVYAPQPWKNGMQICRFPNSKLTTPSWVLGDAAGFTLMNLDFENFAKHIGPLFDDTYGYGEEGLYEDLRLTLLEDPDGPQIDINKELFAQLSPQMTLLARDELPATPDSGQRLIALAAKDEQKIAEVVKKILEFDPNTEVKKLAGHDVYYSYVEPDVDDFGNVKSRPKGAPPSFLACVANGHLLFATDEKILEDALTASGEKSMTQQADYKQVASHLEILGEEICLQFFGRLKDSLRVNYELLRQGKKPNGAKSFRGLLSNIAAGEPIEVEPPNYDASKLPGFDQIEHYLGLAGLVGTTTDEGWYLEGFILKAENEP
jgi:hypothetical protein